MTSSRAVIAFASVAVVCIALGISPAAANRSINGLGNNIANPTWGEAETIFRRLGAADYADGISTLAGPSRPSARVISNTIFGQTTSILSAAGLSDFVWIFGQFLDHDFGLSEIQNPIESEPITVPTGDPFFDPFSTGTQTIPLSRTHYDGSIPINQTREQINSITAYIDGSNVYGSDMTRANTLRSFTDGLLLTSAGNLMPFNTFGLANEEGNGGQPSTDFFLAGDVRANEQVGLIAIHTLFVREHNRLAALFKTANPLLTDEEIYQKARRIVGAELQCITYHEWLPAVLGTNSLSAYSGYDDSVDASVLNEFTTAFFRLGHTMLSTNLATLNNDGTPAGAGFVTLRDAFFTPDFIVLNGIDELLKGLATQVMQEVDAKVIDDIRNFLFGPPGSGGLDLASLNIQRGRDHGIPDLNSMRTALGLTPYTAFSQITTDGTLVSALQSLYADVDDIDLWVGMLCEDQVPGSNVGETLGEGLKLQFELFRDGDRFYYEGDSELPGILAEIGLTMQDLEDELTMSGIIELNSGARNLQSNAFFAPTSLGASVRSDPHFKGFAGQTFDFTGVAGSFYRLIEDQLSASPTKHLTVNAKFDTAYETMASTDIRGSGKNFGAKTNKTWISDIALFIGTDSLMILMTEEVEGAESNVDSLCDIVESGALDSCVSVGTVLINNKKVTRTGKYQEEGSDVVITISNRKSGMQIDVDSMNVRMSIAVVTPPEEWDIEPSMIASYSHINANWNSVQLREFKGILGETASPRFTGRSAAVGTGDDGEGVLAHGRDYYQVSALESTLPLGSTKTN